VVVESPGEDGPTLEQAVEAAGELRSEPAEISGMQLIDGHEYDQAGAGGTLGERAGRDRRGGANPGQADQY
jgi:hypothetical protein